MARPAGSSNIVPFENRSSIATTSAADIQHLSRHAHLSALNEFKNQLRHQRSFLRWIISRHESLQEANRKLNPNSRGPKDKTYRKYRWYAEQQTLLEAINAFEVFFKRSLVALAKSLRPYIPASKIKGSIDAKVLWAENFSQGIEALLFEHQLFHSLSAVDDATSMLIGERRYQPDNLQGRYPRSRIKALRGIFQIRHTLSNNQGFVTSSDSTKFQLYGFSTAQGEVIDPSNEHTGLIVREFLKEEAEGFTEWLLQQIAVYLGSLHRNDHVPLLTAHKATIDQLLGSHVHIDNLPWS
jgi:hypothetical protein